MTGEHFMENFCRVEETWQADGLGGFTCRQTDGEKITAGAADMQESNLTIGGSRAVRQQVTLYVRKDVSIAPGDILRRERDGAVFRLVGLGEDAPSDGLPLRRVTAERVVLPWKP